MFGKSVIFLLALIYVNHALVPLSGACDAGLKIPALKWDEFQIPKYLGYWWMNATYESQWGNCVHLHPSHVSETTFHDHIDYIPSDGSHKTIYGPAGASISYPTASWELNATNLFPTGVAQAPHWVLGINYESWAVLWACVNLNGQNLGGTFILTRDPVMSASAQAEANAVIEKAGLDKSPLYYHKNTDCPY